MTGYGSARATLDFTHLEVIAKSVNSRHLDLKVHSPEEYEALERQIKRLTSDFVYRGSLVITLRRHQNAGSPRHRVRANTELARLWIEAYRQLGDDLKLHADPSLDHVARLPQVITIEEKASNFEVEQGSVLSLAREALKKWDVERQQEGKSLEKLILSDLKSIESLTLLLSRKLPAHQRQTRASLERRVNSVLKRLPEDPRRVAFEVATLVDRGDVREELDRSLAHTKAMRRITKGKGPHGKQLEFYCQELLREWNTIGSKIQSAELAAIVVKSKTVIEQVREQVQNVE